MGGDFVDIVELDGGEVMFAIGDVSGSGLDAAVTTALVRNTLRAHALDGLPPVQVCERTNAVVLRSTAPEAFVTVFYAVLQPATGELRYVSAGHLPGLVLGGDGLGRWIASTRSSAYSRTSPSTSAATPCVTASG